MVNSGWWLWKYAGPRPASTERLPRRLSSWRRVQDLRVAVERAGAAGQAGLADVVLAEDLRRGDLVVPVGLGEVAVAAGEAEAVIVAERAQGLQARRRCSGVAGFVPGNGLPG